MSTRTIVDRFFDALERSFVPAFGLVVARQGERRLEARFTQARVDRDGETLGRFEATMQIVLYEGDVVRDVTEQALHLGTVEPRDRDSPWSEPMSEATKALASALRESLERLPSFDELPMPHSVWTPIAVPRLLSLWAELGPPPGRPERFVVNESREREVATRLRALDTDEWEPLVDRLPKNAAPIANAFALDAWSIVVCMEELGESAQVVVLDLSGGCATLIDEEIAGEAPLPLDGDTVTLRGVLSWLTRVLAAAGFDAPLDVDEDHPAHGRTLGQWFAFRDHEHPLIDWRLQGDSVGAWPLRDGNTPALRTEEGRATAEYFFFRRHPLDEVLVYDRFIRTFIDPDFVSKPATATP